MTQMYECKNLLNCDKADNKVQITLGPGEEPKCPDCQSELKPVGGAAKKAAAQANTPAASESSPILKVAIATVIGVAVLGGGGLFFFSNSKPTEKEPVVVAEQPTAKPAREMLSQMAALQMDCEQLRQAGDTQAERVCSFAAARALVDSAGMNLLKKDFKLAEENLELALQRAPDFFYTHLRFAELYSLRGEISLAFVSIDKALQAEPAIALEVSKSSDLQKLMSDTEFGPKVSTLIDAAKAKMEGK
jgi:hypothetical protein